MISSRWVGVLAVIGLGCSGGAGQAPGADGAAGGGDGGPADTAMTDDGGGFVAVPLPPLPEIAGRIVVTPAAVLLTAMGQTAVLHAEAFGADGQKMAAPTFTWESSREADVTVGADGQLTAATALGSSQIRVRAGALVSPPVTVLVAEPVAGAVLVTDAQVKSGPKAVDPAPTGAALGVGAKVQLSLTGVPPIAPGTVVLASEGKAVAGRVVSTTIAGSDLDVVLETVPLLDLFKRLSVDGSYDVDPAALALALASTPTTSPLKVSPDVDVRRAPLMLGSKIKCETMLFAGALTGDGTYDLRPQMKLDYKFLKDADTGTWTELMIKLDGTLTITGTVSLNFSPMVVGTATCGATLARIPIPFGGPLAAIASFNIPLGLKGEISATIGFAPLKAGLEMRGESNVKLGFRYTPATGTTDLSDFSNKFEMQPTFTVPPERMLTLTASAAFGGTAGLDLSALFGAGSLSLLEAALLLKAEVKASAYTDGLVYGGAYELKPTLEAGPGEDAARALTWLGGAVALKPMVSVTLPTIGRSPRGTFTADKLRVMQDQPVKLTVQLEPDTLSFLGSRNAMDVRIYRVKAMGEGLEVFDTVAAGGGTAEVTFTPTLADRNAGGVTFWAGVTSRLMPGLALEVKEMSALHVTVASMTDPRWKGTITSTSADKTTDPISGDTYSETITVTLMLEHETEEDAFMGKVKITSGGMASLKTTHDYTGSSGGCAISVHEERIGIATTVQPTLVQVRVEEVGRTWAFVGGGSIVGTQHMTHTETGGCVPGGSRTTTSPDTKYEETFGFNEFGMLEPGADHFGGSKTIPGDNAESGWTWTWDFNRVSK